MMSNCFPSRIVITSFSKVILLSFQLIQRHAILIECVPSNESLLACDGCEIEELLEMWGVRRIHWRACWILPGLFLIWCKWLE